jgi:hypothetical protein
MHTPEELKRFAASIKDGEVITESQEKLIRELGILEGKDLEGMGWYVRRKICRIANMQVRHEKEKQLRAAHKAQEDTLQTKDGKYSTRTKKAF